MIRKGFVVLMLVTILFTGIHTFSFAQTPSSIPDPTTKKDTRVTAIQKKQERIDQRVTTVQKGIATRAAMLDERKKDILERIQTHRARVFDRALNAIARLDGMWKRVESRTEKLKSLGADVSSLEEEIAAVKKTRTDALAAIEKAKSAYGTDQTSLADIAADTAQFRQGLMTVKMAIQSYHQSIVAVVHGLKDVRATISRTPTLIQSGPTP